MANQDKVKINIPPTSPGDCLSEKLEGKNWTQEDLASVLGVSLKTVNQILKNKQGISIETAQLLGEAFNTTPEYWINVDTNYRLEIQRINKEKLEDVRIKSELFKLPIKEFIKKGWIKATENVKELQKDVRRLMGVTEGTSLSEISNFKGRVAVDYRRSNAHEENLAVTIWANIAEVLARPFSVEKYDKAKLEKIYAKINEYTVQENGVASFIEDLNNAGVIFMYLPHLQKTYISGASFISERNPCVVYTARYNRVDNFWFTVAHEIAHILEHQDVRNMLTHISDEQKEKQADEMALKALKVNEAILKIGSLQYVTDNRIIEVSKIVKLHPSIIIGCLAFRNHVNFGRTHRFSEDVLQKIPQKYWASQKFMEE